MERIPPRLNDGYTLELQGCFYRRMPASERKYLLGRFGDYGEQLVEAVFTEPWFFGDREQISESEQRRVFTEIIENPMQDSDLRNLINGAKLRMQNAGAADYDCQVCRSWITDHEKWTIRNRMGTSERLPRGNGELLCDTPGGCPRGHWTSPLALTEKNTQAWNHFWEWRLAGMPLPDCPTMRRNWSILAWITEHGSARELRPAIRPTVSI